MGKIIIPAFSINRGVSGVFGFSYLSKDYGLCFESRRFTRAVFILTHPGNKIAHTDSGEDHWINSWER